MVKAYLWLAQSAVVRHALEAQPGNDARRRMRDIILIVGVGVTVMVLLFCWAYFMRRRRHPDQHVRSREILDTDGNEPRRRHRRHRHRRRSQSHRELRRNPTLQETGGLPPPRPDGVPPAF